jgi:hypothetical protein
VGSVRRLLYLLVSFEGPLLEGILGKVMDNPGNMGLLGTSKYPVSLITYLEICYLP